MGCVIYTLRVFDIHTKGILYIGVGLSALLVSTFQAMREPLDREAGNLTCSTFFFVYEET